MNDLPISEKELLEKINLDISASGWNTYKHLISLRRQERLSEEEHEHLISLGEKIEVANAQRLFYISQLAKLRGITLDELVKNLGINPMEV